jgi:SAM-dependent methyltransferase
MQGRVIADVGAGTGATSRALIDAGASAIGVDISLAMLAYRRVALGSASTRGVVADAAALPLVSDSLDGAVLAFCLSHVEHPEALLAEASRVSRSGSPVLAAVYAAAGSRHPAVDIVGDAARRRGWRPGPWYRRVKEDLEPAVADRERLAAMAGAAGLVEVAVVDVEVDTGVRTASELIAWRLGGPGLAAFAATLSSEERQALIAETSEAIGPDPQPLRLVVRILSSVVPASRHSVSA